MIELTPHRILPWAGHRHCQWRTISTSSLTCIQSRYTKNGCPSVTAAEAKGDSSPAYTLNPIFHSLLAIFLSMTVTCEPFLKVSVSFHLSVQNAPDELIRIAREMSHQQARDRTRSAEEGHTCPAVHLAHSYTLQLLRNLTSFDQPLQSLNMSPMENC